MTLGTATPVLDPSLYIPEFKPRTKDAALARLVAVTHRAGVTRGPGPLLELLRLRERLGTTAIGKGVAVPHARSLTVERPALLVARAPSGIAWEAGDGVPVRIVLLALSPCDVAEETHYAFLARIVGVARLLRNRQRLLDADGFDEVAAVLHEAQP